MSEGRELLHNNYFGLSLILRMHDSVWHLWPMQLAATRASILVPQYS